MLNFILWDESPVLFSIGPFVVRWYVLLFILGFLAARMLLAYINRKEGKQSINVEALTIYVLIAALIGARLGYALFYEYKLILSKPLEAVFPFQFKPSFRFVGIDRLSGYGALIAVILAVWLYCRKGKGRTYLQVLDKVVIAIALAGIFVGVGNFFNAEIIGKQTDSKSAVVFVRPVMDGLLKLPCCIMRNPGGPNPLLDVEVKPDPGLNSTTTGHSPVILYLFYKPGATEQLVKEFLIGDVKTFLYDNSELMYESGEEPLHYTLFQDGDQFTGRVRTTGIARHPVQLYEAMSYLIVLVLLFITWKKNKDSLMAGRLSGLFLLVFGLFNFAFEFLKQPRTAFEFGNSFNVGHIVSVLMLIAGAVTLYLSTKKQAVLPRS